LRSGAFYSKGKFLLSGEYFVLYGAKALAVPLKFGQRMLVDEISQPGILKWETFVLGKLWFTARFRLKDMEILDSSDKKTAFFIRDLLKKGGKLRPELQLTPQGFSIVNYIDFDLRWGLGSSSSLVSNLAYWLDVDPYALYRSMFQGSGYDVFCARASQPIIYQLKKSGHVVHEAFFKPDFADHLYFVYLGRKQDSQESVRKFKAQPCHDEKLILKVSDLTDALVKASGFEDFLSVMRLHEETISVAIGQPGVKQEIFPDFNGEIKSLGAWGGDFVMAATSMHTEEVKDYFHRKNLQVVFRWDEIIY
jgi:mevalonate kinase